MADLAWPSAPEFNVTRRAIRRATQTPPEGGFVQRRQLVDREFVQYVLRYRQARRATLTILDHAWAATFRGVLPVTFTPPYESQKRMRIASFTSRWNGVHGEAEVVLEEIR